MGQSATVPRLDPTPESSRDGAERAHTIGDTFQDEILDWSQAMCVWVNNAMFTSCRHTVPILNKGLTLQFGLEEPHQGLSIGPLMAYFSFQL